MSSIYKKGRDGYYYYQTYTFNQKTKKKDKRIFHSLNTKSLEEAEIKKKKLDKKYALEKSRGGKFKFLSKKNIKPTIVLILMCYITINYISLNKSNKIIYDKKKIASTNSKEIDKKIDSVGKKIMGVKQNLNKTDIIIKELPFYNLQKIEKLNGSFNQIKIYVTVNTGTDKRLLKPLCASIKQEYSKFNHILICIYDNSNFGLKLANGSNEIFNIEEKKSSWLAMYTYNQIEGEYFDDNPGKYLNTNRKN
jgi:hypothetical protein